ncbi:MAG TPA: hypothetical protein VHE35_20190, partial [Kofleriaceae bacterium]|nr:hypothetical protein [Kofleriaceae bacterium]
MTITPTLIRWSRASNRRRGLELAVLGVPWMVAGVAASLAAAQLAGTPVAAAAVGGGAALALGVVAFRRRKRIWRDAMRTAHAVDAAHGTSDLLASAAAIEAGKRPDAALAPVVLARAHQAVPALEATAVPPLRLRIDTGGALSALAAVAVVFLLGATGHHGGDRASEPDRKETAAARIDPKELERIAQLADAIARDKNASVDAKAEAKKAAEALARAKVSPTARGALAELSEASRALDRASHALSTPKAPSPEELAKLDAPKLAQQLAEAAKSSDSAALAALAREAMRRAAADPAAAQQLADALAKAAASSKAGAGDPSAERRLEKLAAAAAQMAAGNADGLRNDLAALDRMSKAGTSPTDALQQQLDAARAQLGAMRGAQRDALNQGLDSQRMASMSPQAAAAARAAMAGQPQSGSAAAQDARAA